MAVGGARAAGDQRIHYWVASLLLPVHSSGVMDNRLGRYWR